MADGLKINAAQFDLESKKVFKRIQIVLSRIQDRKTRQKITREAGVLVQQAARKHPAVQPGKIRTIKGKRVVSAIYNTPKLVGKIRAPRGQGVVRSFILPGNLKRSVQVLNLKRTASTFIGPRVTRRTRKYFGRSEKTASGFYAQMLFGSAIAFRKRVMESALSSTSSRVIRLISIKAKKIIDTEAKRQGLQ